MLSLTSEMYVPVKDSPSQFPIVHSAVTIVVTMISWEIVILVERLIALDFQHLLYQDFDGVLSASGFSLSRPPERSGE